MKKLSVAVLLFFAAACAVNPVTGKRELMLMGEQEEIAWGERMYPAVLWGEVGGGGKYVDPKLESYLEGIVRDIHKISHRPELPLDFVIQNSSIPNAWAIPGHVSMTRGLLASLENEAQFAFVMGHEMGHVAARHSAKQYTRSVLQTVALGGGSLLVGEEQGWVVQAAAIGSTLFFLSYSRSDELEADRLGVEYMARAGYRPTEAVAAHQSLERAVEAYRSRMGLGTPEDNVLSSLLSTHPRTEVRLDEVRAMAAKVKAGPLRGDGLRAAPFVENSESLRHTDKAYHHYDKALALFREQKLSQAEKELASAFRINGSQAPFHNLKGLIHLKQKDYGGARQAIDAALRLYPGYQPAWQSLGLLEYDRKEYGEAINYLKKSLELFPQSAGSHYLLGMSYFRLKRYAEAIPHLRAFGEAAPRDPEIHGVLGISYEGVAEPARAYEEYRLQVQIAPDTELGRYAAGRIAVLKQRFGNP